PLALFARGFVALLPLWAGAIPSGIAYGVAARSAALGLGETQLMSLVVFSAAAQVGAVSLLGAGAPVAVLIGTALALNAQLPLLVRRVRTRTAALTALVAGATALLLVRLAPGGVTVLGAGLAGSAAGAWRAGRERAAEGSPGAGEAASQDTAAR